MKRLILSTVYMLFCATGLWAQTLIDGIYYNFDASTQTATVKNRSNGDFPVNDSYSGSITIPSTVAYNGTSYIVTSIGESAFFSCTRLTSVIIPNSVISIGDYAFSGCCELTSVEIPNSVTSIGGGAFSECRGLTSITIPNSVTSIGKETFSRCYRLTSVTIPNSVTSIGDHAFSSCTGLTSVEIPNSVTSIGKSAFSGCTGLTSVTIPNSVTSIRTYAFSSCRGLTSVTIPSSVTSIGDRAFFFCTSLKEVINESALNIVQGSTTNGDVAYFADYVYNGITVIDDFIFSDRDKTLVKYMGNGGDIMIPENFKGEEYTVGANMFDGCMGLTSIIVPCDRYDYFKGAITQYSSIVYGNCTFEIAAKANNEDYGTVTGNGVYNYAKNITLTATPNDHYHFVKWDDGNTEKTRTVTVTQDRTFTAVFAIDEHNVTANANNENYGTVTGEGVYEYGTSITLTATPNDHYHFVKWNDNNTQNPRTVQVTQDRTFTAIFAIDEHNVTLSKNISAAGTVTGDGVYEHNTTVQLTATANEGYRFKGWSDGVTDASREITVTKDTSITANFVALYTIKALASASQGTVSGAGVYEKGETATLVANAKPGYIFAQWADGNDENPRYVTVKGNKTYTAIFKSETTAVSETEESIVETARYDINGRPLTAPTKGVNIVKYSDGSFKKEFVK